MIVSWNWLKEYIDLPTSADELALRLSMAGLNHESTAARGGDLAIDLEVTSNRPDCLGHIGVAREISVLYQRPLRVPDPQPPETGPPIESLTQVTIEDETLCPRYTARVIQGIQVGPSPDWLASRLETIGVAVINNVVDISNYVMFECGQPLHAFDFAQLKDQQIIVRPARPKEQLEAIDHRTYELDPSMCVIADTASPVALAGVMGGAASEVSSTTTDVLIESAIFDPISVRNTSRKLNLHSPSSYRFERAIDPDGVDWASRRCCQLILELAGGKLAKGVASRGKPPAARPPIVLRLSQIERILGITIPADRVATILQALGGADMQTTSESITLVPPSWRSDWEREADLIEEVARIHGYDEIPEDVQVPMAVSYRRKIDDVLDRIRHGLTALGFDEALTASVVPAHWANAFQGWTEQPPLATESPMLRGADRLRESLLPSLLDARRHNESLGNTDAELFETAAIYLPRNDQALPLEQRTLGLVTHRGFSRARGAVETLLDSLRITAPLELENVTAGFCQPDRCVRLAVGGQMIGFVGEIADQTRRDFGLREQVAVAEVSLDALEPLAQLVPHYTPPSPYPAMRRDLNLIVDQALRWADVERTVRQTAGDLLEEVRFQEVYISPDKDGPGKKRFIFGLTFRSSERTLTGEEVDRLRDQIVAACSRAHGAQLLGASEG